MKIQNNATWAAIQAYGSSRLVFEIVRLGVSLLCILLIGWKLQNVDFVSFTLRFFNTDTMGAMLLWGAVVLAPVNLGLEAARWRLCLARIEPRSWCSHLVAVTEGIAVGLPFTHLVGDYSSKLSLARGQGAAAAPLLVVCSFGQYLATYGGGVGGLWYLISQGLLPLAVVPLAQMLTLVLGMLFVGYIMLPRVYTLAKRLPYVWAGVMPDTVPWPSLHLLLLLSLFRYGVILGQYGLLANSFVPGTRMLTYLAGTAITLSIKTLIPFLSVGGMVGLREVLALTVLGALGFDQPTIIAVSLSVWILNMAIPGLVGASLLARRRAA